ncbi:MAG: T9SS type A sorting domain-containing protein [Brumimicrobium sp.]|nr:T9SS type A sorting domain-containing protein [Brumimicrobium sp.]
MNKTLWEEGKETNTFPDDSSSTLVIYPNPNNGSCVVKIPRAQLGGSYAIVNTSGVVLRNGIFHEENEKIFDLPSGIYYFQWRFQDEREIKK